MMVRKAGLRDFAELIRMRRMLWPKCPLKKHEKELAAELKSAKCAVFIANEGNGKLCGFIEVQVRPEAEGCETEPVAYIEGWYVDKSSRRKGVGKALVEAAEKWACSKGLKEIASDCEIKNKKSYAAHKRLGYVETNKLVHFKKKTKELKK